MVGGKCHLNLADKSNSLNGGPHDPADMARALAVGGSAVASSDAIFDIGRAFGSSGERDSQARHDLKAMQACANGESYTSGGADHGELDQSSKTGIIVGVVIAVLVAAGGIGVALNPQLQQMVMGFLP